jgi:hypothetical protein
MGREAAMSVAALLPAESIALTVAVAQLRRGENPEINVTATLALTVDRLAAQLGAVQSLCETQGEDSYVMVHALRSVIGERP